MLGNTKRQVQIEGPKDRKIVGMGDYFEELLLYEVSCVDPGATPNVGNQCLRTWDNDGFRLFTHAGNHELDNLSAFFPVLLSVYALI